MSIVMLLSIVEHNSDWRFYTNQWRLKILLLLLYMYCLDWFVLHFQFHYCTYMMHLQLIYKYLPTFMYFYLILNNYLHLCLNTLHVSYIYTSIYIIIIFNVLKFEIRACIVEPPFYILYKYSPLPGTPHSFTPLTPSTVTISQHLLFPSSSNNVLWKSNTYILGIAI